MNGGLLISSSTDKITKYNERNQLYPLLCSYISLHSSSCLVKRSSFAQKRATEGLNGRNLWARKKNSKHGIEMNEVTMKHGYMFFAKVSIPGTGMPKYYPIIFYF